MAPSDPPGFQGTVRIGSQGESTIKPCFVRRALPASAVTRARRLLSWEESKSLPILQCRQTTCVVEKLPVMNRDTVQSSAFVRRSEAQDPLIRMREVVVRRQTREKKIARKPEYEGNGALPKFFRSHFFTSCARRKIVIFHNFSQFFTIFHSFFISFALVENSSARIPNISISLRLFTGVSVSSRSQHKR